MLRQFRTPDNKKLWLDLSQALEVRETGKAGEYLAVFSMDYNHAYTIREFIGTEEDIKASIGTEAPEPESKKKIQSEYERITSLPPDEMLRELGIPEVIEVRIGEK